MKKLDLSNITTDPEAFERMIQLLGLMSEVNSRLKRLEADASEQLMGLLIVKRGDYAQFQSVLTEAEANIKSIAAAHPEWFSVRKNLTTPFGSVKRTSGTKLVTASEDMSIMLIEREGELNKEFKPGDYLREKKELNREALEGMDDKTLKRFGVVREKTEDFKIEPAKVDLGKAIEQAAKAAA